MRGQFSKKIFQEALLGHHPVALRAGWTECGNLLQNPRFAQVAHFKIFVLPKQILGALANSTFC
jgi:hypothetical protein